MINSACSRRKLEPKCICMLCVVSLFVFVVIALFLPPRGPQERLILYGTQLDRQLQEQGNSRDENSLNRVDIRTAINKKKAFGFIDGAKHASDSKSDQAPQLQEDSHFDKALEFKEGSEFDQALEFKEDQFQNITEDGNYVVYNTYVDGPEKGWVRAIGFSSQRKPTVNLQCLFWDANMNAVSKTTDVTIQILPFHTSER